MPLLLKMPNKLFLFIDIMKNINIKGIIGNVKLKLPDKNMPVNSAKGNAFKIILLFHCVFNSFARNPAEKSAA